jgi:hypothetical protein
MTQTTTTSYIYIERITQTDLKETKSEIFTKKY